MVATNAITTTQPAASPTGKAIVVSEDEDDDDENDDDEGGDVGDTEQSCVLQVRGSLSTGHILPPNASNVTTDLDRD